VTIGTVVTLTYAKFVSVNIHSKFLKPGLQETYCI